MTLSAKPQKQSDILDAIRRLDATLLRMVDWSRDVSGRVPGGDPFRGLYVSEADVLTSLQNGSETVYASGFEECLESLPAFAALGNIFTLSVFELNVLLMALVPDIDPRYERIFSYLQDDVSRRRPGIDLIFNVLCRSAEEKLEKRSIFHSSSPLLANGLIRLSDDELLPLSRREVRLDARIASFLMDEPGQTISFVQRVDPENTALNSVDADLVRVARIAITSGTPLTIHFRGADEDAKKCAVIALAADLRKPLLIASLSRAVRRAADFEDWLQDLRREALLEQAIVFCEGLDALPDDSTHDAVLRFAAGSQPARFPGITILSGTRDWRPGAERVKGVLTIAFEPLRWPERRSAWEVALANRGMSFQPQHLDTLAGCFHFTRTQIEDAVETARNAADFRRVDPHHESAIVKHVFEAARVGSGHELKTLTRKVVPSYGWEDIVLPEDAQEQLREICRRVTRRHQVLGKWGFERKLSGGKGVNALFHGHSGTGKTMAAEVIASALRLDLYKIDLAGVVSKYIGETEKNLDRIFTAAETANAILSFDEADALFGKRSEVRDSHDRYANLEISYLLQKMEQYEGVAILATNLRQNLDEAFLRRLTFTVAFPFPDETSRRRIWNGIWPTETPLAPDVDNDFLAVRFLLSGGNIRNVALAAAYLAVEDQSAVTLAHVLKAVRAEFHKMGKILTAAELAPPVTVPTGVAE